MGSRAGVAVGAVPESKIRLSKFVFHPLLLPSVTVVHEPVMPDESVVIWPAGNDT
jgi:hypothetical protein